MLILKRDIQMLLEAQMESLRKDLIKHIEIF